MPPLPTPVEHDDPVGRSALSLMLACPGVLIVGVLFVCSLFLNAGRWEPIMYDLLFVILFCLAIAPVGAIIARGKVRWIAIPSAVVSVVLLGWFIVIST